MNRTARLRFPTCLPTGVCSRWCRLSAKPVETRHAQHVTSLGGGGGRERNRCEWSRNTLRETEMKTRQKLTPWIDGQYLPVRNPVYQRNYGAIDDLPDTSFVLMGWETNGLGSTIRLTEAFFNDSLVEYTLSGAA